MKLSISPTDISGEVEAPPSKSHTHRAILAGCLSEKLKISDPLISEDTKASVRCAKKFGAEVEEKQNELLINGTGGRPQAPKKEINCENSGTTLRLFAGVASLCNGFSVLVGDESLTERPNQPLLNSIEDLGGVAVSGNEDGSAPIFIRGPIQGGETEIDGNMSSQFISSLLLAAPLTERGVEIIIKNSLKSRPYVDITLKFLQKMGIKYEETESGFKVQGNQNYGKEKFKVPGDFSSASYPLAAGALTGDVKVRNLHPDPQGDSEIIDLLDKMGAKISWNKEDGIVELTKGDLKGIEFDASDNPDLVPTLAVLGTKANGRTKITNIEHLRYKETDRIEALATELSKMNVDIEEGEDYLIVNGNESELRGAEVDGKADHRMVMALSIAGIAAKGETIIERAESVEISYPDFFEDLSSLGASIEILDREN